MAKKINLNLTDNEKLSREITGLESDALHFAMNNQEDLETMVAKQKAIKFNQQVGDYVEKISKHEELIKEYAEKIVKDANNVEIMPMMTRVLIKPFEINPFQQIKVTESGLIIDTGGFAPEVKSNDTGKWEEQQQTISVGTIIEVGPDCKYLKAGDAVYFQRAAMVPVPFFKQGFVTVSETQIIAVVNDGLKERFNKVK